MDYRQLHNSGFHAILTIAACLTMAFLSACGESTLYSVTEDIHDAEDEAKEDTRYSLKREAEFKASSSSMAYARSTCEARYNYTCCNTCYYTYGFYECSYCTDKCYDNYGYYICYSSSSYRSSSSRYYSSSSYGYNSLILSTRSKNSYGFIHALLSGVKPYSVSEIALK